jgi:ABC-type transporter MlaC component
MSVAEAPLAALDSAATAVEAETPAIETPAEIPAVETEAGAEAAKTEDGKPADKAVADTAPAPISSKQIVDQLQELKKTNEPLARAIHGHVKQGFESQRFLKENGVKDFSELKTKLSAPDETTETLRQSVEDTDAMLYRGDLKALTTNILEDITDELGDEAPARFTELTNSLINQMKETDSAGYVRHQRSNFLDTSEQSGLIESLNKLSGHLVAGRTADAKALLSNVVKFFQAEISADENGAKASPEQQAKQSKAASAAVDALRTETTKTVNSTTNRLLGNYLAPFLQKELKGLSRPELEKIAAQIYTDAHAELGKDADYVKSMSTKYASMKTPQQQRQLLKVYEEKLKSGFGKRIVDSTVRRMYADKFKAAAPKPTAPASTQVIIGGKSQTVFQLAKRPINLVRSDVGLAGRTYTTKDLELLQSAKGIGLVPNKSGSGHSFVCWRKS